MNTKRNLNVLSPGVQKCSCSFIDNMYGQPGQRMQVCSQIFQLDRCTEISKWAGRSKKEEKKPDQPRVMDNIGYFTLVCWSQKKTALSQERKGNVGKKESNMATRSGSVGPEGMIYTRIYIILRPSIQFILTFLFFCYAPGCALYLV